MVVVVVIMVVVVMVVVDSRRITKGVFIIVLFCTYVFFLQIFKHSVMYRFSFHVTTVHGLFASLLLSSANTMSMAPLTLENSCVSSHVGYLDLSFSRFKPNVLGPRPRPVTTFSKELFCRTGKERIE